MNAAAGFGIVELVGLAASVSLLAGWRLYLVVLVTGLAMRSGWVPLPEHLETLAVLGDPWVLSIAAVGAAGEFLVDKFAFFDSAWNALHTLLPRGGFSEGCLCVAREARNQLTHFSIAAYKALASELPVWL